MPLIECPDCKNKVSDIAPSCPNCGRPISTESIQTIQATGKKLKLQQVVSVAVALLGFGIIAIKAANPESSGGHGFGVFLFLGGIGFYIYGRILIWWRHE